MPVEKVDVRREWRVCVCGWQGVTEVALFGRQEAWTCPSCQRQHDQHGVRA
jgi:hypothetical protein